MLVGWQGTGLLDAKKTHLAKLRAIQKYLHTLKAHEDDDLVTIVDGYDVIVQLPPQVMIERYFQMAEKADARLAKEFNISVEEARSRGLRQTVFWGPDKLCWPVDHNEPRCWAAPKSTLGDKAFGPKTGNGDMVFADPRWLNSGTVIGPVDDLRDLIDATMDEIEATYDPDFGLSDSDQFYVANVWGRQEYYRSVARNGGDFDVGGKDRRIPYIRHDDQQTEFHVSIDYESALFQTKAGYEPFFGPLQFNGANNTASQSTDYLEQGEDFEPYDIQMPPTVAKYMSRLYDDVADAHPGTDSTSWLKSVKLGTNFVTQHIYALWHSTGPKEPIDIEYTKFWFFPLLRPLIKASIKSSQKGDLIWSEPIDGRLWAPKMWFPNSTALKDPYGGVWTDVNTTSFLPWADLCGQHEKILFAGDHPETTKSVEPPKKNAAASQPEKDDDEEEFIKANAKETPKATSKESPKPEQTPKPKATKPEEPKPEQPKPEEPKPEEPKPEAPKPEAPKPEEPKPEEPKPEEPPLNADIA
jgi:hypothetical protein